MSRDTVIELRKSGLILACWGWNYWVELGEPKQRTQWRRERVFLWFTREVPVLVWDSGKEHTVVIRHMRTYETLRFIRPTVQEGIDAAVAFVEQRRIPTRHPRG